MTEGAGEEDKKLFSEVKTVQQAAFDKTGHLRLTSNAMYSGYIFDSKLNDNNVHILYWTVNAG